MGPAAGLGPATADHPARLDDDAGASSGSAYVFDRNAGGAGNWGQVAKLTAADMDVQDRFGFSVSIDGEIVAEGVMPFG